jgi:hypothetical protein
MSGANGLRIKIIATSAHFALNQDELPDGGVFLPKPYTSNRIINALRECIGTAWRAPFVQIHRGGLIGRPGERDESFARGGTRVVCPVQCIGVWRYGAFFNNIAARC